MLSASAIRLRRKRSQALLLNRCIVCCAATPPEGRRVCSGCNTAAKRRVAASRKAVAQSPSSESASATTARHLFRHLYHPSQLRKNELARSFFEKPLVAGLSGSGAERASLELRRAILATATACREDDVAADAEQRGHRQYTIVTRHYFDRQPIEAIARELGLSVRQCYRERAVACQRIGLRLSEQEHSALRDAARAYDVFHFQMERASLFAETGHDEGAVRVFDGLARSAAEAERSVHALCSKSTVLLRLGRWDDARVCTRAAQTALDQRTVRGESAALFAQNQIDFEKTKLQWDTGDFRTGRNIVEIASRAAESAFAGEFGALEFCLDVLVAAAYFLEGSGEPAKASEYLKQAETLARRSTNAWRKCEILIAQSRLERLAAAAACQMDAGNSRLARAEEIARRARECGSSRSVVHSTINLMQEHLFGGDAWGVLRLASLAAELARRLENQNFSRFVTAIAADAAVQVRPLNAFPIGVPEADGYLPGTEHWFVLKHAEIVACIRSGRYREGWLIANEVKRRTRFVGKSRSRGALMCRLAVLAHGLGYRKQAVEYVGEALESAGRYNTAFVQLETFRAAAMILGDRRFDSKVRDIREFLQRVQAPVGRHG